MDFIKAVSYLTEKTVQGFIEDNVPQMAAALSFYGLFALPPIIILTILALNTVYSTEIAQQTLISETSAILGDGAIGPIKDILSFAEKQTKSFDVTQMIGIVALLISATGILGHIQRSLNTMWHLEPKKQFVITLVTQRLFALLFIGLAGIFLIVSVLINTAFHVLYPYIEAVTGIAPTIIGMLNTTVSFVIATLLIALAYRIIPSGRMNMKDVAIGAIVTAVLYTIGKSLLSMYLSYVAIGSAYGTAGSVLVLLFWIYYSALIFFFGAEFTYIYSTTHGKGIQNQKKEYN